MGYLSDYLVQVENARDAEFEDIVTRLKQFESIRKYSNNTFGVYSKWYDYREQIGEVSKLYPKVLFVVTCLGEDGERWGTYIHNGKYQDALCHISYDPFDPSKLIDIENV